LKRTALAPAAVTNAAQVATLQAEAEELATLSSGVAATTPEEYALIDSVLTEAVRKQDAATAMRKGATRHFHAGIAEVNGWFKPIDRALAEVISNCKSALGAYRLEQERRERAAAELAAKAAEADDADTMIEALTERAALAEAPAGGARCSFSWKVKRIAADMLAAEWLCPDVARIEAFAKAHKGGADDPPIIAGVTFERVANMGARH
jgi:hypothetical protein